MDDKTRRKMQQLEEEFEELFLKARLVSIQARRFFQKMNRQSDLFENTETYRHLDKACELMSEAWLQTEDAYVVFMREAGYELEARYFMSLKD